MNIYQKLMEVRKTVDYLQKSSQGFGFKYTSSSQVLGAVRQAMNDQGLLLIPNVREGRFTDHTTDKGKVWKFTEITVDYQWVNVDEPSEKLIVPFYAQGMDDAEKGVGKALTYGEKYFILKFFNIPTDLDDPDAFNAETGKRASQNDSGAKYMSPEGQAATTGQHPASGDQQPAAPPAEAPAARNMDDPATAGQKRLLKSLAAKNGFEVPENVTKAQAAALIQQYNG